MEYLHAADPPVIHGNLHAVCLDFPWIENSYLTVTQSNVFVDSQGQCLVSDIGTMGDLVSDFVFKVALNPRRASWTAPEIMPNLMPNQTGQDGTIQPYIPLTKKTDVFAFAMTLIEVSIHICFVTVLGTIDGLPSIRYIMAGTNHSVTTSRTRLSCPESSRERGQTSLTPF